MGTTTLLVVLNLVGMFPGYASFGWVADRLGRRKSFILYTLAAALLMVSRVSYPHITKQILRGRRPFSVLVQLVLALFLVALTPDLACFLLFWGYALSGLARHILLRLARDKSSLTELEPQQEPGIHH